jgi:hypothetical protein
MPRAAFTRRGRGGTVRGVNPSDLEFLKRFYQHVADSPLDPASDSRYVPLYGEGDDPLGEDPVDALARGIREVTLLARSVPVDDSTVESAINPLRAELLPISDSKAWWLARVAETHEAALDHDDNLPNLARFFDTGVVLCYRDGPEWYDVHPLIREIVIKQVRESVARGREPEAPASKR